MPANDDELLKRLLATFKVEARDHLQTIGSGLVELEKASEENPRADVLDATFRSAHSLKGAARAVNLMDIESVCQAMESVFADLKRGAIERSTGLFDLLHQAADVLEKLVLASEAPPGSIPKPPITEVIHSLERVRMMQGMPAQSVFPAKAAEPAPPAAALPPVREMTDTVRVATSRLDAVLLQVEELLSAKLSAGEHAARLKGLQPRITEWKKRWAKLRPDMQLMRHSIDAKKNGNGSPALDPYSAHFVEFLEWNQFFFETLETDLMELTAAANHDDRAVGAMVDNLLDEMKKVVMQPFSTLLDVFPRLVRDLSRNQHKEVDLVIHGGEVEIDRRILEEMKDPCIHLVRNCLDHGIEAPAERVSRGKSPRGTINVSISAKNGSNVELLISDDGAGIDTGKVKAAVVRQGLVSREKAESFGRNEAITAMFESGISTSPMITDISGRGLGLAIVKEKVEKLNGLVSVETEKGKGSTFRIVLPLTLARFRGIIVSVWEHLFVLPTSNVERVARIKKQEIVTVENRETISINGEAMSLARLSDVLELPAPARPQEPAATLPIVVLAANHHRIAFVVDGILNEQEVLVKPLGKQLQRVVNVAGATVLSTGKVAAILSVPDLMRSAVRRSAEATAAPAVPGESGAVERRSVLVAEDSITSRTLLKNILETAGYQVQTAVDGVDAFTKLQSEEFDIVISDVDMPRMNGFGLTAKIRADKRFSGIPVVLVTALDSRQDREHGIDVGANAYIVKSSFDQSNLLEVIRRFI